MIGYVQDTDSRTVYALPHEIHYALSDKPANETLGGAVNGEYLLLPLDSDILRPAWELTYRLENKDIAQRARRLLSAIQELMSAFRQFQFDLGHIPQLHAFRADDGSVLLEWVFGDYRIGFNIEPDPQDSGWFLVTNRNLGEITASGFISGIRLNRLILWLLTFMLAHS
jgi:hypothetical protein